MQVGLHVHVLSFLPGRPICFEALIVSYETIDLCNLSISFWAICSLRGRFLINVRRNECINLLVRKHDVNMPLCASTGPVLVRCWQHRSSTCPVLAHTSMCMQQLYIMGQYRASTGPVLPASAQYRPGTGTYRQHQSTGINELHFN